MVMNTTVHFSLNGVCHEPEVELSLLQFNELCRYPPYFDDQPFGIYEKILNGKIDWPRHVDPIARYLCSLLSS